MNAYPDLKDMGEGRRVSLVTTSFNPFRGGGRERVNAYPRDVSELTRIPT